MNFRIPVDQISSILLIKEEFYHKIVIIIAINVLFNHWSSFICCGYIFLTVNEYYIRGALQLCRNKPVKTNVAQTRMARCPTRPLRVIPMRSPRGHSTWRWQPGGLLGDLISLSPRQTMHPLPWVPVLFSWLVRRLCSFRKLFSSVQLRMEFPTWI